MRSESQSETSAHGARTIVVAASCRSAAAGSRHHFGCGSAALLAIVSIALLMVPLSARAETSGKLPLRDDFDSKRACFSAGQGHYYEQEKAADGDYGNLRRS